MPKIDFKHVVSFSSENAKNPAENLLKPESYFKWKCNTAGESKAIVVIQLEKATQIHSVDIGNNGSAFVEVLTGRSTWEQKDEYQVLLVASSFMSPSESKAGSNLTRVRMFGPENLNKTVSSQKWDMVKLVCTQPYNKDEAYGLSFIQLHSPPEEEKQINDNSDTSKTENFKAKIGNFTLRDETEKDEISTGSFFSKRSQISTFTDSLAASARDASSSIMSSALSSPTSTIVTKTTHATTFVPKRDYTVASKQDSSIAPKRDYTVTPKRDNTGTQKRDSTGTQKRDIPKSSDKQKELGNFRSSDKGASNTKSTESTSPPSKKIKTSERPKKNRKNLPFNNLMKKVVFVLSGFKNPERSNLRDTALSMGAKYRPDWGPGCTHLICAFKNTPKFNQVKGKGKIVSHRWIKDCAKGKERLSMKQYRMDGGGSSSDNDNDSEDNECTDAPVEQRVHESNIGLDATEEHVDTRTNQSTEDARPGPSTARNEADSEEYDTEDELRRAREATKSSHDDDDDDPYGGSTEDESDQETANATNDEKALLQRNSSLPALPDFYEGKRFLLYGDFDPKDRRLLNRYITAYNGMVEDYMNDQVQFVISDEKWDNNFDEALSSNSALVFVHSKWIFKCHELQSFVPVEHYCIKKN